MKRFTLRVCEKCARILARLAGSRSKERAESPIDSISTIGFVGSVLFLLEPKRKIRKEFLVVKKSSKKILSIVIDVSTRRFIDHSYRIAAMKWTDNAAGRSAVPDSRGSESTSPGAVSAYSRFFLSERVSSTSKRSGDDHASRLTFRIRTPYTNSDRDKSVLFFLPCSVFVFFFIFFFFYYWFIDDSSTSRYRDRKANLAGSIPIEILSSPVGNDDRGNIQCSKCIHVFDKFVAQFHIRIRIFIYTKVCSYTRLNAHFRFITDYGGNKHVCYVAVPSEDWSKVEER